MNVRQVNCVVYRQLDVIFLCFVCNVICFDFITNYMLETKPSVLQSNI